MIRLLHNQTETECLIEDIGICIIPNHPQDLSDWDLDEVLRSDDLFALIEDKTFYLEIEDNVIVETSVEAKRCFTPLTQFCTENVELNSIKSVNLTATEEFIIVNLLNMIFKTHIEEVLLRDSLQNVFLFLGHEYNLLEFYENVAVISGGVELAPQGDEVILDAYETGVDDIELYGDMDTVICSERDGQLIVAITEGHVLEEKVIIKQPQNTKWKNYDYVVCDVDGIAGVELSFVLNGTRIPISGKGLSNGRTKLYFDISSFDRKKVQNYGFVVKLLKSVAPCELKISSIKGLVKDSVYRTGELRTSLVELDKDIKEVFVCNEWHMCSPCELIMLVSLDGGENWQHIEHGDYNDWVDVSMWNMNVANRLMVKFIWDIDIDVKSPVLDDFFIMYRV